MPDAKGRACCAACSQYFDVEQMDVVTYGTGYRCSRRTAMPLAIVTEGEARIL